METLWSGWSTLLRKFIFWIFLLEEIFNVYRNNDEETGSTREEKGYLVKFPDSDKEELVVMGSYGTVDKDGIETFTMFKADRNGYRPMLKVRKYSPNALKTISG